MSILDEFEHVGPFRIRRVVKPSRFEEPRWIEAVRRYKAGDLVKTILGDLDLPYTMFYYALEYHGVEHRRKRQVHPKVLERIQYMSRQGITGVEIKARTGVDVKTQRKYGTSAAVGLVQTIKHRRKIILELLKEIHKHPECETCKKLIEYYGEPVEDYDA